MTVARWFGRGDRTVCRCGHDQVGHEHYRRGSDCSSPGCDCIRFRRGRAVPAIDGALELEATRHEEAASPLAPQLERPVGAGLR